MSKNVEDWAMSIAEKKGIWSQKRKCQENDCQRKALEEIKESKPRFSCENKINRGFFFPRKNDRLRGMWEGMEMFWNAVFYIVKGDAGSDSVWQAAAGNGRKSQKIQMHIDGIAVNIV